MKYFSSNNIMNVDTI